MVNLQHPPAVFWASVPRKLTFVLLFFEYRFRTVDSERGFLYPQIRVLSKGVFEYREYILKLKSSTILAELGCIVVQNVESKRNKNI